MFTLEMAWRIILAPMMGNDIRMGLENSYAALPERFFQSIRPTPVAAPALVKLNESLAEELGLDTDWLQSPDGVAVLAGNRVPDDARPLAMAYAGHQFGHWAGRLGDGRAILLGERIDQNGVRRDIQLKGAGPTIFSRGGDGRASIGPVVREYLASEAMAALGIPTTRALAVATTGEEVYRQRPEPGGILVRVAESHVRVGTFQYLAATNDFDGIQALIDYLVDRHYPQAAEHDNPVLALLEQIVVRTARLVADWMLVGFIHGVMNTDNTSLVGETLDFGPFGFIDEFHPDTVYSSIDRHGRYAWSQQPGIAAWNLARLGEALLPAAGGQPATESVNATLAGFRSEFESVFHQGLRSKLGFQEVRDEDVELAFDLLGRMQRGSADLTLTFRGLSELPGQASDQDQAIASLFDPPELIQPWLVRWRQRLAAEHSDDASRQSRMQAVNPAFILRNHLAQAAVDEAIERGNFSKMEELLEVISRPFEQLPDHPELYIPPRPEERVLETFCGT